ncbi:MAG: hypothetical protein ACYSSI_02665, partial [Planctomycetota bacterium]
MLKNRNRIIESMILFCIITFCASSFSGQIYKAKKLTRTISGSAGIKGVVMKGLPGNIVTNQYGYYTATVDYGWSGTVTPAKEGYAFEPVKRTYAAVTIDQKDNYTATFLTYAISGTVTHNGAPLSDVVINGLPGTPDTDEHGYYSVTVGHGWSGEVMPVKKGYLFATSKRVYTKVTTDLDNQGYTAELITFTISGSAGIEGVVMKGLPGDPVTKQDGLYSVTVDYGWSGTVTPMKEGYTFTPPKQEYTNPTHDQDTQDYTATLLTSTISGSVGIEGVVMKGLPGNIVSNQYGLYTATVDYGWSGIVIPTKKGYTFDPPKQKYTNIKADCADRCYSPGLITLGISGTVKCNAVALSGVV